MILKGDRFRINAGRYKIHGEEMDVRETVWTITGIVYLCASDEAKYGCRRIFELNGFEYPTDAKTGKQFWVTENELEAIQKERL